MNSAMLMRSSVSSRSFSCSLRRLAILARFFTRLIALPADSFALPARSFGRIFLPRFLRPPFKRSDRDFLSSPLGASPSWSPASPDFSPATRPSCGIEAPFTGLSAALFISLPSPPGSSANASRSARSGGCSSTVSSENFEWRDEGIFDALLRRAAAGLRLILFSSRVIETKRSEARTRMNHEMPRSHRRGSHSSRGFSCESSARGSSMSPTRESLKNAFFS
mmetsp:Transcript_6603/g.25498  ORF Transcript_6603/g.25498 Transcript_6603/m.25498 type:complete len:222 (+) Transcript_6603:462-1127(+)